MPQTDVDTATLLVSGEQLAGLCPEIASSLAGLTSAASSASSGGHGELAAAASGFAETWSQSLADLEAATGNLAQNVQVAAGNYEVADRLPGG